MEKYPFYEGLGGGGGWYACSGDAAPFPALSPTGKDVCPPSTDCLFCADAVDAARPQSIYISINLHYPFVWQCYTWSFRMPWFTTQHGRLERQSFLSLAHLGQDEVSIVEPPTHLACIDHLVRMFQPFVRFQLCFYTGWMRSTT